MAKTHVPQPLGSNADSGRWTGWVVFASIMLTVVGGINIIQGLAALLDESVFVVHRSEDLLVFDFDTWGVVLVVWGVAQAAAGMGLNSGHGWARIVALIVASISILFQTLFLAAYPIWSVMIIALDVIVIFALTARWAEARAGL